MKSNKTYWRNVVNEVLDNIGAIGVILGLMVPAFAQADDPTSLVFPRDSVPFGRTYGEWSAAWWQWALSIPVSTHPLFDNGDCSVGQSGPVWFLGGKSCASNATDCPAGTATRSCTVPAGKALLFPIVNVEDSVLEESSPSSQTPACQPEQPNPTINCLRKTAESFIEPTTNLKVEIDGQSIPDVKSNFREQSIAFDFTLPIDNLLTAIGEGPFSAGTYSLAVDDGVYLMLKPLPVGNHTIHFTGTFSQFNPPFIIDITYNLNVVAP